MKVQKFETEEEWKATRLGKVTGTRLKDLIVKRGTEKKKGYWELIAERLGIPADSENVMERGKRLETEAIAEFTKQTGKAVNEDLVIWMRDDNEAIALSPDGTIDETSAVEVKCLSSASHIEALLTQKIPSEYEYQVLQYFIVNDKLETLYFCFYDPRIAAKPFFFIEVKRKDLEEDIKTYMEYQKNILKEIDEAVLSLSNF